MDNVDPRLRFLQEQDADTIQDLSETHRFALEEGAPRARKGRKEDAAPEARVRVLVQFDGEPAALEKAGLDVGTVAGDVVTGTVALANVDTLAKVDGVRIIEAARPMLNELNRSIAEVNVAPVWAGPPGRRGAGVIVGIIDSGIDITHGAFRGPAGQTRVRRIWDQNLAPQAGEARPAGFTYGVEYTAARINAALASANPATVVRHRDSDGGSGHGTHVAGIAAGDGSPAGGGFPAFTFVGVAPEAEIIAVLNRVTTEALGDSAQTLDAAAYIYGVAAALGRPAVINLSQGDNIGPHDGTSLLERGLDNLLGPAGRAFVKSAGNEGDRGRHAMGTVPAGGAETLRLACSPGDVTPDIVDVWYAGADRLACTITPPGGAASAVIEPGTSRTINLPGGNRVFVDSRLNDPNNGDNRIFVTVQRGTAAAIAAGAWALTLHGRRVSSGRFHAWVERSFPDPTFVFQAPHRRNSHTLSIPGTSREVIAVGSYITAGAGVGNLSGFSSRGPTRDGRRKPELCAPGQSITSARAAGITSGAGAYHALMGTSMSAPHVAGAIALMLEGRPTLTQAQIRDCLVNAARADAFTGAVPNDDWGAGKLDVAAAVRCRRIVVPTKVRVDVPNTINKALDDGILTANKNVDDGVFTLKRFDDGPLTANKFMDDGVVTTKLRDDGTLTVNKLHDDGPTTALKALDDGPVTTKVLDDGGKPPILDQPQKTVGSDLPPLGGGTFHPGGGLAGSGRTAGLIVQGGREAAPFVLSTPHHSMAWAAASPGLHQQELAQAAAAVAQYEAALAPYVQAAAEGQLSDEHQEALAALDAEYRAVLAEYEQLARFGQGG